MGRDFVDLVDAGVPQDITKARDDVEHFRLLTQQTYEDVLRARDEAVTTTGRDAELAHQMAIAAQQAAHDAKTWMDAGAGITAQAEEPSVQRLGMLWLVESSKARTPTWPGAGTTPGNDVYPQRSGTEPDGRHLITAIRRWDGTRLGWTTLVPGFPAKN